MSDMQSLYLLVPLAPLLAAIIAGLCGSVIGRRGAHVITILGVAVAFIASLYIFADVKAGNTFDGPLYTWGSSGNLTIEVGFLIDSLTVMMMLVVSFVSLMVHIYTIGYMSEDPGYQRFFSYISLFTFAMLMLVMSNNFMQLFFGWEAVGLVSYLLIGFWYERPTAVFANMKAFLINRVGDFGFLLGIALIVAYTGSLNYAEVFSQADSLAAKTMNIFGTAEWGLMSVICIGLFIGAMGKSAQIPLHVWLPDSMEGPTPISALIHAATMVTAGIFMVARMSPLFEHSEAALSFVLVIGASTALFMGFLGITQNDIKRVVAYSTLSQLGYMTVALGVSVYSAAVFHLMTHAFFKALLFLAAGSVIIGMHHDQDIRNMGGLRRYMPITWITSLIGSLALIGFPLFSGFYSKDIIIEAVHLSKLPGAHYAYFCVMAGVFVTAFYSFRMYFLVFHGKERFGKAPVADDTHHDDAHADDIHHHHGLAPGQKPHESPWVVTVPLILLAVPSMIIGYLTIQPMLFGNWFDGVIHVFESHNVLGELATEFHGAFAMAMHGFQTSVFLLLVSGVALSWLFYIQFPQIPATLMRWFKPLYYVLDNKYFFDAFNQNVLAKGSLMIGRLFYNVGDRGIIDGAFINGTAQLIGSFAALVRKLQTGYLYQYAFVMILGLLGLLIYTLHR